MVLRHPVNSYPFPSKKCGCTQASFKIKLFKRKLILSNWKQSMISFIHLLAPRFNYAFFCLNSGISQLLYTRTSRKFLACRLHPEMENKILFLTSKVKNTIVIHYNCIEFVLCSGEMFDTHLATRRLVCMKLSHLRY